MLGDPGSNAFEGTSSKMNQAPKHTGGLYLWVAALMFWVGAGTAFAGAPVVATLTSPANGATKVALSCTFQWTGVAAAQAYYLWVGTSPGTKDVVMTSGGLPASSTSYTAKNLPRGQTLYATIWTELAGIWWASQSSFTTVPPIAVLTSPANGATNVASSCTFRWTGVAAAQAYYLWVGTSPGAEERPPHERRTTGQQHFLHGEEPAARADALRDYLDGAGGGLVAGQQQHLHDCAHDRNPDDSGQRRDHGGFLLHVSVDGRGRSSSLLSLRGHEPRSQGPR